MLNIKQIIFRMIPDKLFLKIKFFYRTGKKLNLKNPQTFNEKLQWLKLYNKNPEYTKMVDKYEAKKYVAQKIGEEYIIPTLGVWDKFDDIDFDKLPNQFVLKCTHDSGGIVICKDKSKLNIKEARNKINKRLKMNYFYHAREWPYKNVKARIIAEKYMEDKPEEDLKDYKIFCFNGQPKFIQVDFDRFIEHKRNIYSLEWKLLDFEIQYPFDSNKEIKKPSQLNKMIDFAKILSKDIPYVRVDFYSIGDMIYFGELTFYHGAGYEKFDPEEIENKLGDFIDLNMVDIYEK